MKRISIPTLLALVSMLSSASASVLSGGPSLTPPGSGSPPCSVSGRPEAGGATLTCSGLNLAASTRLYYGIDVNNSPFAMRMRSASFSGSEFFRVSSVGSNQIVYTGSTYYWNEATDADGGQGWKGPISSRTTVTFQNGTGVMIDDAQTQALTGAPNGDVRALWRVQTTGFTTNVVTEVWNGSAWQQPISYFDSRFTRDVTDRIYTSIRMGFYFSTCGDGILEPVGTQTTEICDAGVENNGVSCCTNSCTIRAINTTCRSAFGDCDLAEVCDGTSAACPADAKSVGLCRAAGGICGQAEFCDGVGNNCPPNQHQPPTTICRSSVGDCDAPDYCTGASPLCPADAKMPPSTLCRTSAGICDPEEYCTGNADFCPADSLSPPSSVCRTAADLCDEAEHCTGTSVACPPDALASPATVCRGPSDLCDAPEHCTGTAITCPADVVYPVNHVCRSAAGVCDEPELCDGIVKTCPIDELKGDTVPCRTAADVCDADELCTGTSAACPPDRFLTSSTECRASMGVCDPAEVCPGDSPSCPPDSFASISTVCRTAVDVCDLTEYCTGTGVTCPVDSVKDDSFVCRSASNICDVEERCNGIDSFCPADSVAPDTTLCRSAAGVCDEDDYCDGIGKICPPDLKKLDLCRPSAGDCDVDDYCDGVGNNCPPDLYANFGTECRAVAGVCDVAEQCTGTDIDCPPDGFQPNNVVCRPAVNGTCDLTEKCDGTQADCPPDLVANEGDGCSGNDDNTCMNTCVSGQCVAQIRSNCCGNGQPDLGEQCDDGNQISDDGCPSGPNDNCTYPYFVRGTRSNPIRDKRGCQLEWYVVNPNNPLDKRHLPNMDQDCRDNDPSCDLDPTPGLCRVTTVLCLNTTDPALTCDTPGYGVSVVRVKPVTQAIANVPIVGPLALQNINKVNYAVQHLLDPMDPNAGYSKAPPISAAQKDLCSEPMTMDLVAIQVRKDRVKRRLVINTKSSDNRWPRARSKRAKLRLTCVP